MYNLKFKKTISLLMYCSLLFTGCFPSGGSSLSMEDDEVISHQIESIVSENEYLQIDVELNEDISELPKIKTCIMEWDDDKVKETLLKNKTDVVHEEGKAETIVGKTMHRYKQENGYRLYQQPGNLNSREQTNTVFGYSILEADVNYYRFEDFFTEDSISVLSKEEATKRCTDILDGIGLTNYSEPKVYAITIEKANQLWITDGHDKDNKDYKPWTSPDEEAYILCFCIEYEGIPVTVSSPYSETSRGEKGFFIGSKISFVVTKGMVYSLNCFQILSPEYEKTGNVKINCSAENALKIAAEHYDTITLKDMDIKITDCELVYVTEEHIDDRTFVLTPMWKINAARRSEGDIMGTKEYLFIDVQTGNIILSR